jgi:uncharacterized membrane protein YsdA (DUF1294 family)
LIRVSSACLFLAVVCGLAARGALPPAVPAVYLATSVAALIAYRGDKFAAQSGAWRTRERTLHVLSVMGGWPGALIAQALLRHKSRKLSFQIVFATTVVLNCAALFWVWWGARS